MSDPLESEKPVDSRSRPCIVAVVLEPHGAWRVLGATEDVRIIVIDKRPERLSHIDHQDELALPPETPLLEPVCDELASELQSGAVTADQLNRIINTTE